MIRYQKDIDNIVTLRLDMSDRKVNIINHEIGKAFLPVLAQLQKEKDNGSLNGVILTSDKSTFLAGGDLDYLYKNTSGKTIFKYSENLKAFFRALEMPGIPVAAAINGTALGSGFELPLACHYRVAIDNSSSLLGFPEVSLGMMPGSGGNIRMLWLLGIEQAFSIISSGKKYSPREALQIGIIDELAKDETEMIAKAKAWLLANPEGIQPWDKVGYSIPGGTPDEPIVGEKIADLTAGVIKTYRNNYPAPMMVLSTLVQGSKVDFDMACRIESRNFAELMLRKEAKNMTKVFWYDLNALKQNLSRPKGFGKFRPKRIGIVGAGKMGSGIGLVSLLQGMEIVLKDISKPIAERGKYLIRKQLQEQVSQQEIKQAEADKMLEKITTTDSPNDFKECDIVIEAVFENEAVKRKVAKETGAILDEDAIFATNTTLISISKLGEHYPISGNYIGLRFFMPAATHPLVEVVAGKNTSQETIARAYDFVKKLKKTPIIVNDSPGFYVKRVENTFILEGITMLQEGISPAVIENVAINAGMPLGPLALADLRGLESVYKTEREAAAHFGQKYIDHPASQFLHELIEKENRKGIANNAGFYNYKDGIRHGFWNGLNDFIENSKQTNYNHLKERFMFAQVVEALWCLSEKVVTTEAEANLGSVLGWGFPSFTGGVINFIDDFGINDFIKKAKELESTYGRRFKIASFIEERNETPIAITD